MSAEYGISFVKEKCIQCHGCEVACKSWRDVESGLAWRRVYNIWLGSYPSVKSASVSTGCMHCADPACIEACPEGAIEKRDADGVVVVNSEACTGCRACFEVCPFKVPEFGLDGKMQKCDLCVDAIDMSLENPPCVATCPTRALCFGPMSRQEKKAAEASMLSEA
jgi:anaerobic dimethyl sulfoxide reductase subunit B